MQKPKDLQEVKNFIFTQLKERYGEAVLSDSESEDIVIDTDTEVHGVSDVWMRLEYFH